MAAGRRGWDLYISSAPHPTRSEINDQLREIEMVEISDRMYTHYQRLERYGRKLYVPINTLDVEVKGSLRG